MELLEGGQYMSRIKHYDKWIGERNENIPEPFKTIITIAGHFLYFYDVFEPKDKKDFRKIPFKSIPNIIIEKEEVETNDWGYFIRGIYETEQAYTGGVYFWASLDENFFTIWVHNGDLFFINKNNEIIIDETIDLSNVKGYIVLDEPTIDYPWFHPYFKIGEVNAYFDTSRYSNTVEGLPLITGATINLSYPSIVSLINTYDAPSRWGINYLDIYKSFDRYVITGNKYVLAPIDKSFFEAETGNKEKIDKSQKKSGLKIIMKKSSIPIINPDELSL